MRLTEWGMDCIQGCKEEQEAEQARLLFPF